jgi:SAM-dependent methyltransferase
MSVIPFFKKYPQRACAICDSVNALPLFRQTFSEMSKGSLLGGYDVVICEGCGFAFADRIPGQSAFDAYYCDMSKYEHEDQGGEVTKHDVARFRATVETIRLYLPDLNARLIDVGCSTGQLLALLKESGYKNVTGLDPSSTCAKTAQELFDIQVLTGVLADVPRIRASEPPFDVVILIGVLEHLRDLASSLTGVRELASPNALIYIEVPDATDFASWPDAPFQEFSTEHINYFSSVSLTNLMSRFGFTQVYSRQIARRQSQSTIMPVVTALYRKEDLLGTSASTPDTVTKRGLEAYIARSRQTDESIRKIIDDLVMRNSPVIVWGVGTHTLRLLETSRLAQANIVAFVDSNPRYQGKELHGRPIVAPADLYGQSEPILISSRVFQTDIEKSIRKVMGLKNEIIKIYPSLE